MTSERFLHHWPFVREAKWPLKLSFDVAFVLNLNEILNTESSCRWFQTHGSSCHVPVMKWLCDVLNNESVRLSYTSVSRTSSIIASHLLTFRFQIYFNDITHHSNNNYNNCDVLSTYTKLISILWAQPYLFRSVPPTAAGKCWLKYLQSDFDLTILLDSTSLCPLNLTS